MDRREAELNQGKVLTNFQVVLAELNLEPAIDFKEKMINALVMDEIFMAVDLTVN